MDSDSKNPGKPDPPRIVSRIDAATLEKFYPREAEKRGIEGTVNLVVDLDPEARVLDVQVLTETPPDMGFGAAAAALAKSVTYSNPTGSPVAFRFKVKFELNGAQRPDGPAVPPAV